MEFSLGMGDENVEVGMENVCPICDRRVSDWMMCSGKAKFVDARVVHNACLQDFKLKHGYDYGEKQGG